MNKKNSGVTRAGEAMDRVIAAAPKTILDIGSGNSEHADAMRRAGLRVTTIDATHEADIRGDYLMKYCGAFACIWCSHVLEHCRDVGSTLEKMRRELRPNGLLAITVPPMRETLVGGHVNTFNEGTLIYNLILAGFDCSKARVGVYGYNISVLVQNIPANLPDNLTHANGEIERLKQFFPWNVKQAINGRLGPVRW